MYMMCTRIPDPPHRVDRAPGPEAPPAGRRGWVPPLKPAPHPRDAGPVWSGAPAREAACRVCTAYGCARASSGRVRPGRA